jgi:uncharacterized Tic20 family protein
MSSATSGFSLPTPSADDRTNALLVHVLAIFTGFIAPLAFFLLKRNSRFVVFHSLQVLIWQAAYVVIFVVGIILTLTFLFISIAAHPHPAPGEPPPLAFFGLFGVMWLWGMGGWALNLILGIVYGIKASQGEWARYPLIGNFVLHRILPKQQFSESPAGGL